MEQEIWKTAQYIFENGHKEVFEKYQVSNMGRVKSLDYNHTGKEGILKQGTPKSKYGTIMHQVHLTIDKKFYSLQVHRLVLSTFKESEFFEGAICDHIEARTETECCDRLDNLRWVTHRQNISTEHCKELLSKAHTNRPDQSKCIRVTDLATGEVTEYPSAREAGRALDINPKLPAAYISKCKGYCKRRNLHFEYL